MGELEPSGRIRKVSDERGADGTVEKIEDVVLGDLRRAGEKLEVEFTPDHCGQGEHALGVLSQAHHAPTDHLSDAVGQCVSFRSSPATQ